MKMKIWLCFLAVSSLAMAQDYESLAKELAKQRSEVEQLSSEVSDKEESLRQELKTLAMQKAELDSAFQKEELRQKQLIERKVVLKNKLGELSKNEEVVVPMLNGHLDNLRSHILKTIPFKTTERLKAVDELQDALVSKKDTPYKVANKMWSLIEDELRLAKENVLAKQNIKVGGQEYLADVAKLGMTNMYFKIDERVGYATTTAEGQTFVEVTDKKAAELIKTYFTQLKKQLRAGEFALPGNYKLTNGGV